jgi:hypothetical protein
MLQTGLKTPSFCSASVLSVQGGRGLRCLWQVTDVFDSKIYWGFSAVVSCAGELSILFSDASRLVTTAHRSDFKVAVDWIPNKWRPGEICRDVFASIPMSPPQATVGDAVLLPMLWRTKFHPWADNSSYAYCVHLFQGGHSREQYKLSFGHLLFIFHPLSLGSFMYHRVWH